METKELNLCEILKGHEGEKFYSPVYGYVTLSDINDSAFPLKVASEVTCNSHCLTENGKYYIWDDAECVLFPSKDQRDWAKWIEEQKSKFPKTWKDIKICNAEILQAINHLDYGIVKPAVKSAIALLKIHELIEVGYGGNITKEEWESGNPIYSINYIPRSSTPFQICNYDVKTFDHIAFHTNKQAKEFLSYPENVQLVKDFYMI